MNYCYRNNTYTSAVATLEVKPGDREAKEHTIIVTAERNSPVINVQNKGPGPAQLIISAPQKSTIYFPIPPFVTLSDIRFFSEGLINFNLTGVNTDTLVEIITPD